MAWKTRVILLLEEKISEISSNHLISFGIHSIAVIFLYVFFLFSGLFHRLLVSMSVNKTSTISTIRFIKFVYHPVFKNKKNITLHFGDFLSPTSGNMLT
jgi:hypothetical protein